MTGIIDEEINKIDSLLAACYISQHEYDTRKKEILTRHNSNDINSNNSNGNSQNDYNKYNITQYTYDNNYTQQINNNIDTQINQLSIDDYDMNQDVEAYNRYDDNNNDDEDYEPSYNQTPYQNNSQHQEIQFKSYEVQVLDQSFSTNQPKVNDLVVVSNNNNNNKNNNKSTTTINNVSAATAKPTFASMFTNSNTNNNNNNVNAATAKPTFASMFSNTNTSNIGSTTAAPYYGSSIVKAAPEIKPQQQRPSSHATQTILNNGRSVNVNSVHQGVVLQIEMDNWIKEKNNYRRPNEPTQNDKDTWKLEQTNLATKVIKGSALKKLTNGKMAIKLIGGMDISFAPNNKIDACVSIVVVDYQTLKVVYEGYKMIKLVEPYIAGFLAFREVPHLMALWNRFIQAHPSLIPDVVMIDGNGINHMRGLGLASHLGVLIGRPTMGVAKQLLVCHGITEDYLAKQFATKGKDKPAEMRSSYTNELLGYAMYNSDSELTYISPGHMMDSNDALQIAKETFNNRPIPEPTYQADHVSREFLRKYYRQI